MAGLIDRFFVELERFRGQPYVYGAEVSTSKDPTGVGPVDCSELTSVAARRVGLNLPDGAYNQCVAVENTGQLVPADEAIRHRGWLLFYDDGTGSGRDRVTHVAVSTGDGQTTYEARNEGYVVSNQPYAGRKFTTGGPPPGLDEPEPNPTTVEDDFMGVIVVRPGDPGEGAAYLLAAGRRYGIHTGEDRAACADVWGEALISRNLWDRIIAATPDGDNG